LRALTDELQGLATECLFVEVDDEDDDEDDDDDEGSCLAPWSTAISVNSFASNGTEDFCSRVVASLGTSSLFFSTKVRVQ
jgi:hypothetical protein